MRSINFVLHYALPSIHFFLLWSNYSPQHPVLTHNLCSPSRQEAELGNNTKLKLKLKFCTRAKSYQLYSKSVTNYYRLHSFSFELHRRGIETVGKTFAVPVL
jgi:hypothetical protein